MKLTSTLFLVALAAVAQDKPAPTPKVPAEVEAEYYRADGSVARVQAALTQANADLQAAIDAVKAACGTGYTPQPAAKHIECVAVPKPAPPSKEK